MLLDDIATALSLDPSWRDLNVPIDSYSPQGVLNQLERHGLTIVRISEVGERNG